ncbi:hypothetical protein BDD12DRAFT_785781 [Trichophaea hybrida]|nr:hypothetical protein BDD12DRAFT_785781 [Trichophaea hybrida]
MEITQWYAVSLGGPITFFIVWHILSRTIYKFRTRFSYFLLKHLIYPQITRRLRGSETFTLLHSTALLAYVATNTVCTSLGVKSVEDLRSRSGIMALINLMPLGLGNHTNLITNTLGLSMLAYSRAHRWVGRIAVIHSIVHVFASLISSGGRLGRMNSKLVAGVIAMTATFVLVLSSLRLIRRLFFEFFIRLHVCLALVATVSLWYHIPQEWRTRVYLVVFYGIWAFTFMLRISLLLYRNIGWHTQTEWSNGEVVTRSVHGLHVSVRVRKPWEFRAGQVVYVRIPGISLWGFIQSYPFFVTSWSNERDGTATLELLLEGKGTTRKLGANFRAFVEGPYGQEKDLGSYGTVLMFATNFGIVAQLPYIKRLLEANRDRKCVTRTVVLHWMVTNARIIDCVEDWMPGLLANDVSIPKTTSRSLPDGPRNTTNSKPGFSLDDEDRTVTSLSFQSV